MSSQKEELTMRDEPVGPPGRLWRSVNWDLVRHLRENPDDLRRLEEWLATPFGEEGLP